VNLTALDTPRTMEEAPSIQAALDALPVNDDWAVRAVEILLVASRRLGCSDLHVLCRREAIQVRGRREGDLLPFATLDARHREMLIARLKILARIPAFVRHEPQDGRIEWRAADDAAEAPPALLRVSFLPTIHGENVVIRFPERRIDLELGRLGMPPDVLATVRRLLARPEGTLLLTGPSSSGKTSTMYAMLAHMAATHGDRLNFLTIEDPVERDLGFAGQVQVDEAKGLTFERALRAALRQDPNVLMIGEIRDLETARTALQAGMTGHLVLSTLHAGRSDLVFSRLLSLGVSRYLAASALTGVVAQRLVRLLCRQCRAEAGGLGWTAPGCAACGGTGHAGRTGLFELVPVNEGLRTCILSDAPPERIAAEAARARIGGLPAQARRMVAEGEIDRLEYEGLFAGEEEKE
jgi:general secretion pathway protein E